MIKIHVLFKVLLYHYCMVLDVHFNWSVSVMFLKLCSVFALVVCTHTHSGNDVYKVGLMFLHWLHVTVHRVVMMFAKWGWYWDFTLTVSQFPCFKSKLPLCNETNTSSVQSITQLALLLLVSFHLEVYDFDSSWSHLAYMADMHKHSVKPGEITLHNVLDSWLWWLWHSAQTSPFCLLKDSHLICCDHVSNHGCQSLLLQWMHCSVNMYTSYATIFTNIVQDEFTLLYLGCT